MLLVALALAADPPPPAPQTAPPAATPSPADTHADTPADASTRPLIRSDAPMLGPPERSLVSAGLRPHFAAVSACYQPALLRRPTLAGRVKLRLAVAAGGHIEDVTLAETSLEDAEVEACLVGVFSGVVLPGFEAASPFVVLYPFDFQPS